MQPSCGIWHDLEVAAGFASLHKQSVTKELHVYVTYKIRLLKQSIFRASEGERFLKRSYKDFFGKDLNTNNPTLFSEKLFNKMILRNRHKDSSLRHLVDKYLARSYVEELVGEEYLTGLIWRGADPRLIPFDQLPAKCIAKTNHGSGGNIILDKTTDRIDAVESLRGWLRDDFYWAGREYQYYGISPQVIIEKFLDDGEPDGPLDYRFWCFNGKPELVQVDNHRHSLNSFYDVSWTKLPLHYRNERSDADIAPPENYEKMLQVASKLSSDFDFVRIDLYNIYGKIHFGEFTFTPVGGRLKLRPEPWDMILGQKWPAMK